MTIDLRHSAFDSGGQAYNASNYSYLHYANDLVNRGKGGSNNDQPAIKGMAEQKYFIG
ncbi:MAG: hypothetical protein ACI9WS_001433 [Paraglaciecola psychrophila]